MRHGAVCYNIRFIIFLGSTLQSLRPFCFVDLVTVATMTTDPQTPCVCLCFRSQSLSVLKVSKGLLVDCY